MSAPKRALDDSDDDSDDESWFPLSTAPPKRTKPLPLPKHVHDPKGVCSDDEPWFTLSTAPPVVAEECADEDVAGDWDVRIDTAFGNLPRFWPIAKNQQGNPGYKTNVVYGAWDAGKKRWKSQQCIQGKLGNYTFHSVANYGSVGAAFASMCDARRGIVDTKRTVPSVVCNHPTDGTLVVNICTAATCKRPYIPIAAFAPDPLHTRDDFERYELAVVIVADAEATAEERAEAMHTIEAVRTLWCSRCRATDNNSRRSGPNSNKAAFFAMAQRIRDDLAKRTCTTCGQESEAMQCDHTDPKDKIEAVLQPVWWYNNEYGPDDMWREYLKTVPRCSFCHFLEPTHTKHRGADSTTMPTATKKEQQAKLVREYVEENAQTNNGWKAGKLCFYCERKVKPGEEHAFQWMHSEKKMVTDRVAAGLPRLWKRYGISRLQADRVSPETFVRRAEPEITTKCELGCANCHWIRETLPERLAQVDRLADFVERTAKAGGVRVVVAQDVVTCV